MYLTGHSLVRRRPDYSKGTKKPKGDAGWTLHKDECGWLKRASSAIPAPVDLYPGTVACRYCRPSLTGEEASV
ncbi:MAG TPA: hypothetical protein VI172_12590 [Candidatus Dormibacteraeota bacterium]|jgi:hypothetical protein